MDLYRVKGMISDPDGRPWVVQGVHSDMRIEIMDQDSEKSSQSSDQNGQSSFVVLIGRNAQTMASKLQKSLGAFLAKDWSGNEGRAPSADESAIRKRQNAGKTEVE